MKTSIELLQLGKQVSDDFVSNNVSMTESLVKLANTHSLNQHELHRVAESANIDAYLKLISKSEDKYLEFPLANAKEAFTQVTEKTATVSNDTDEFSDLNTSGNFSFDLYKKFNKVAMTSTNVMERNELNDYLSQAIRLKDTTQYIENNFYEESASLQQMVDKGYELIKQAFLQGVTFSDLSNVISTAAPNMSEALIDLYKSNLAKESVIFDLTKEATFSTATVNSNNPIFILFKEVNTKGEYIQKIAEAYEEYVNEYNTIAKTYKVGFEKQANVLTSSFNFFKKHPVMATTLTVGPTAFIAGKEVQKTNEKNKIMSKQELNNLMPISNDPKMLRSY